MKLNGNSYYQQMKKLVNLLQEDDTKHAALTGRTVGWTYQMFRSISRI